ncbi:MAG: hypothetical protein K5894_03250 [Lachnospiraceae bacterium]|nr:hypothetical protein [Lachnospiraceae bacterium]
MSWKIADIEKLFEASDFSKKSDLKKSLLHEIIPRNRVSFEELESRYGKKAQAKHSEKELEEFKRARHNAREKENVKDGVMKNDKPILPNR